MAEKRKTWKDRKCGHGRRVEFRIQIDAAYCHEAGCFDAIFARLGYVPGPELLEKRESREESPRG